MEVATAKIGESCKIEKEIEFLNSSYNLPMFKSKMGFFRGIFHGIFPRDFMGFPRDFSKGCSKGFFF